MNRLRVIILLCVQLCCMYGVFLAGDRCLRFRDSVAMMYFQFYTHIRNVASGMSYPGVRDPEHPPVLVIYFPPHKTIYHIRLGDTENENS